MISPVTALTTYSTAGARATISDCFSPSIALFMRSTDDETRLLASPYSCRSGCSLRCSANCSSNSLFVWRSTGSNNNPCDPNNLVAIRNCSVWFDVLRIRSPMRWNIWSGRERLNSSCVIPSLRNCWAASLPRWVSASVILSPREENAPSRVPVSIFAPLATLRHASRRSVAMDNLLAWRFSCVPSSAIELTNPNVACAALIAAATKARALRTRAAIAAAAIAIGLPNNDRALPNIPVFTPAVDKP